MQHENIHLTDQDLLLASDGELCPRDETRVESHLAACWECRVRSQELEQAVAGFLRAHQNNFDAKLSAPAGPRALLKAQLAELAPAFVYLATDESSYVTGSVMDLTGGRMLP